MLRPDPPLRLASLPDPRVRPRAERAGERPPHSPHQRRRLRLGRNRDARGSASRGGPPRDRRRARRQPEREQRLDDLRCRPRRGERPWRVQRRRHARDVRPPRAFGDGRPRSALRPPGLGDQRGRQRRSGDSDVGNRGRDDDRRRSGRDARDRRERERDREGRRTGPPEALRRQRRLCREGDRSLDPDGRGSTPSSRKEPGST